MMAARVHPPTTYDSQISVFKWFLFRFFFCGSDFIFLAIVNFKTYYSESTAILVDVSDAYRCRTFDLKSCCAFYDRSRLENSRSFNLMSSAVCLHDLFGED
jgi:hypothetical protein